MRYMEVFMEEKISRLFDYQKFAPNARLDSIIKDVESRYELDKFELSDDELGMVNAAGSVDSLMGTNESDLTQMLHARKDTLTGSTADDILAKRTQNGTDKYKKRPIL